MRRTLYSESLQHNVLNGLLYYRIVMSNNSQAQVSLQYL